MNNAMNLLDDLAICLNIDAEDVEPFVIKCYIALRLQPLLDTVPGATKTKLNALANIIATYYFMEDYSIDNLINSVYNYINITNKCPTNNLLNDDIETFLQEYANDTVYPE